MGNSQAFIAVLWITMLMMPPDRAGQTPSDAPQTLLPPGVGIQVKAVPEAATVGDPIQIDLDITMPAGYQVKIPRVETQAGDFAVLDFFPGPTVPETSTPRKLQASPIAGGAVKHHRARVVIAIYKTGKFVFPSIRVQLKTAEGKDISTATPPVGIDIQSVLTNKDRDLKDLKKQAEIPEPTRWLLWIIIALAGSILGVVAWRLWRRRRRPIAFSPAQTRGLLDLAEADLKDLLARGLPAAGMEKQFYVLLSEIAKKILEPGYEIHTTERTTSEIVDSLRHRPSPEPANMELIESFLLRCDIVKFAKYVPSQIEHEAAAKDALQILAEARRAVGSRQ